VLLVWVVTYTELSQEECPTLERAIAIVNIIIGQRFLNFNWLGFGCVSQSMGWVELGHTIGPMDNFMSAKRQPS